MGLWKEHFHWSVLLGWNVLGWIVALILGIAGLFLAFDQYWGANVCFILASTFVFAKIVHVGVIAAEPVWHRIIFSFLLFGVIGVALVETVRGVNEWATSRRPPPPPPAVKIPAAPPITKKLRFTTVIPLTDASKNVPIPMNTSNEDPKADFYQDLLGLTLRPDQPPPGITYRERRLDGIGDKFIFVTRLIQYYVLHSLRVLQAGRQGTRWTAGKGVTPIDVSPIPAPDAAPYSTDTLIRVLGNNEFFSQADRMLWSARPFQLPQGTIISLSERQPNDGPLECSVRLERVDYYQLDFIVSPGIAIQGQPPAGFQTPTPNVSSYPVTVTMKYEIQRPSGFQSDVYAQWADALFVGLKNIMAP